MSARSRTISWANVDSYEFREELQERRHGDLPKATCGSGCLVDTEISSALDGRYPFRHCIGCAMQFRPVRTARLQAAPPSENRGCAGSIPACPVLAGTGGFPPKLGRTFGGRGLPLVGEVLFASGERGGV